MNQIRIAATQYYLDNIHTRAHLCAEDMEDFEQWLEHQKSVRGLWWGA